MKKTLLSLYKIDMQITKATLNDRKLDARRKIQLGGLVIKSGLGDLFEYDKETILGILVEGFNNINGKDKETYLYHYTKLGKDKFIEDYKK